MSPAAKKYYSGGIRFVRDGVPCRMASWVNDLTEISRSDMLRGTQQNYRKREADKAAHYWPDVRGGMSAAKRAEFAKARHPQTTYLPLEAFQ